jgi:hypothetical protein
LGLENAAFEAERTRNARHAINRLLSLVRTTVPDQGAKDSLAQPLEATLAVLKEGRPTQRDFAMQALQNFVLQAKAQASCRLDPTNTASLVATAYEIRRQLSDDVPLAVVYTRHGHGQNM